jgi:glycine oxidase
VGGFDVAIIGGGIIGGSIAFELARQKLRVILLDRQRPGQEASWAAAGMLSPAPESPDSIPLVPLARASLELYSEFVAAIEQASERTVGYRADGALETFFAGDAQRELSTLIALHHGLGLPTEALRLEEARQLEPAINPEAGATALLPYEASVDNRALTDAVLAAASRLGVTIRADCAVTSIMLEAGRCLGVVAAGEAIQAGHVVAAAGIYSSQIQGLDRYAPTRPVRGQMAALLSSSAEIGRVLRSERGYIVPRDRGRPQKLIVGSTLENAGFEKKLTPAGLEQILRSAQQLVPGLQDAAVVETWSGLRPDTPDHLPVLGPTDLDGLLVATGHYRNGILLAPITAKLIREWLTERRTSLPVERFSPLRFLAAQRQAAR